MKKTELKVRPEFMKPLVTADATFTSVGDCQVTEQDLEKGRRDLRETENKRIEGLQKLKARFARKWNFEDISFCEMVQIFNVVADIMSVNPSIQFSGLVTIWDFRGLTLKHITEVLYPSKLQFLFSVFQEIYPCRPKLIIGLYTNPLIRAAFKIIRPVVKNKIAHRIKFLGSDMSELHQYVHPALLPKEYGGMLEEDECNTAQFILDNLPYIKYERSFGF